MYHRRTLTEIGGRSRRDSESGAVIGLPRFFRRMNMNRPYVIYHMMLSVDGKINGDFLNNPLCGDAVEFYYRKHREYRGLESGSERNASGENRANAFLCGRVTMQGSFTGYDLPDRSVYEGASFEREDYAADTGAGFYAVAVDTKGRLNWTSGEICDDDPGYDRCHIVEILCEDVDDRYLSFLREKGISYIFAGKTELELKTALLKLKSLFGIDRLLLEGGGIIGGKFAKESCIDELSFITAPVIEGGDSRNVFADSMTSDSLRDFVPEDCESDGKGSVWVRYLRRKAEEF